MPKFFLIMVSVQNLTVDFGKFLLFNDISFLLSKGEKVGLVGKNGAGKSTLLKLIAGEEKPNSGTISMPKDFLIGYLPQQLNYSDTGSLKEEALKAFANEIKIQNEIDELTHQIANRTDYESDEYAKLLEQLTEKNERLALFQPEKMEAQTEKILKGLGFSDRDMHRATSEFSGGWRMRIELAKILLKNPDIFLLDEPTNHLDIESIQWLENFLKAYKGTVVVISHDRKFLDNLTQRTIEISLGKVYDYKVPYSQYLQLREERFIQQKAAYENQQKMIQDTEKFIERFRYKATKAVQVQSRIKQLEKLDRIEIDELDRRHIAIKFPPAPRSGTIVVEGNRLVKKYGEHLVLNDIDFTIERGDKVAFIGKNGEGKTTLIKMILGETDFQGELKIGHNVNIGYFAQNQEQYLDENKTVFETIDDVAVGDMRTKVRDILGAFMFSGETVDKKVQVLSGGERARLAIAQLLLQPYNLLILDEPTNHLDIPSKDILKRALQEFDGTVILVSHDRYFLEDLPTKVYEFSHTKIKLHLDSVAHILQAKLEAEQLLNAQKNIKSTETNTSDSKKLYELRKDFNRKIRKLERKIEKIEQEIELQELLSEEISTQLANPEQAEDIAELSKNYENTQNKIALLMKDWENNHDQLEKLKSERP